MVVDCAALATDQLERALFGDAQGGGLVAEAAAGTLFLDEVCSLSFDAQSTLLRLIQHGTYRPVGSSQEVAADVRIIASTNRDPLFEMREGRFREDLYYRLHVVPLRMPTVRERSDDLLLMAQGFLAQVAEEEGEVANQLSDAAAHALQHCSWPGNVRQLENTIRQLVLLGPADEINEATVYRVISGTEIAVETHGALEPSAGFGGSQSDAAIEPLWITEKKAIEAAIAACDGSVNRAAQQCRWRRQPSIEKFSPGTVRKVSQSASIFAGEGRSKSPCRPVQSPPCAIPPRI